MSSPAAFFGQSQLAPNPAIFDFDTFDHLTMGDLGLQKEVLSLFREQISATSQVLKAVPSDTELRSCMHTLRGAAASVGATAIVELAKRCECDGLAQEINTLAIFAESFRRDAEGYFRETERILGPRFRILDRQNRIAS